MVGIACPAGGRIVKRSIILASWLALVVAATAHGELLYGVDGTEFHAREGDDVTACEQPQLVFQP